MDDKNFITKKRKNIFLITKITNKNNNQDSEKNNEISKEIQPQSLINISKYVLEFIRQKRVTTYNNVIKHIKTILQSKKEDKIIEKNIQRRVYESINIMSAIGYLNKKKQRIEYIKKDLNNDNIINKNAIKLEDNQNIINKNVIELEEYNIDNKDEDKINKKENKICDLLEKKYREKVQKLEELQKSLIKHYLILKFVEKYTIEKNETEPENKYVVRNKDSNEDKKEKNLIFNIVKFDKDVKAKMIEKEKEKEKVIGFLKKYQPYEIIKRIMAPEMISKLNIIENETKDTNNNNNEEINNQNNENDIVFNYLRNKRIFKDELMFNYSDSNDINNIINSNKK